MHGFPALGNVFRQFYRISRKKEEPCVTSTLRELAAADRRCSPRLVPSRDRRRTVGSDRHEGGAEQQRARSACCGPRIAARTGDAGATWPQACGCALTRIAALFDSRQASIVADGIGRTMRAAGFVRRLRRGSRMAASARPQGCGECVPKGCGLPRRRRGRGLRRRWPGVRHVRRAGSAA